MEQKQLTNSEIDKVTAEILIYKQQTAQNIIEIGKRLIKVKESLPHGEWGKWLEEKVDFSSITAQRFMRVAKEFSNTSALKDLSSSKLFALLELPSEERKDFISQSHEINGQTKTVDEMTSRELQKVIKEKKELEQSNQILQESYNELSHELQKEKNKKPETIEVEVDNTDYTLIKKTENLEQQLKQITNERDKINNKLNLMTEKADAYEQDSMEYTKMKEDITYLTNQKDALGRQLQAITDISGLVVEIDHLIKGKLAPVRYSKSLLESRHDEIVQRNLTNIVETVEQWCTEIRKYIPRKTDYVEVIE